MVADGEIPKPPAPKLTPDNVKAFLEKNPILLVVTGLLLFAGGRGEGPAWRKDLPPLGGRTAGPWRGKGSFGHGFGPQLGHK